MDHLSNYTEMLNFIETELDEVIITSEKSNIKAAATLLTLAIDHAQGIRILLSKKAYPSAAALMRVIFETYIRGMWIWKCANQTQIDKFINKDKVISTQGKNLPFREMVEIVESEHGLPTYLSEIQKNVWNGLNSLTHGGQIQLVRNFDGKTIRHCYDEDLVIEIIDFATMLSCFSLAGILDLSDNKDEESIMGVLMEKVQSWAFNNQSHGDPTLST